MISVQRVAVAPIAFVALATVMGAPAAAQEFAGPFASWADARRDYGARGDGRADDTAALQRALDRLGAEGAPRVLYLPAGAYRLTGGLRMTSQMNVGVFGEDPLRTTIFWDGPEGGVMLTCNGVRYSRFGRLTWDGRKRASAAVVHAWDGRTPGANTHNEHADEVFRDVGFGIRCGSAGFMDAECPILRCRFVRCTTAGVSIENFNALDWWVWNSLFEDCRVGVTNVHGAGHFHVYDSVFLRSTECDMTMGNTSYFSVRRNVSVGSAAFFRAGWIGAGAGITLQRNTIIDPRDRSGSPIVVGNLGPALLLDNTVRFGARAAAVVNDATNWLSVGNTYTFAQPIAGGRKLAALGDRVVAPSAVPAPRAPETAFRHAPRDARPVIEVKAGASAAAIQAAIARAAARPGGAIVHLPAGDYAIDRPLVVPAQKPVRIAGDGYATLLRWSGAGPGPVLRLAGPSHAMLSDLTVSGEKRVDAVVVEECDQPGARVWMEQGEVAGSGRVGLLADGLRHADVCLHDFYHSGCAGVAVKAVGPGRASRNRARVCIFGGASSNNDLSYDVDRGGSLMAQDIWYEGQPPGFLRLTGSGDFTLNGAQVASADPNHGGIGPENVSIAIDGFRGRVTLLTAIVATRIRVLSGGPDTRVLALCVQGNGDDYFRSDAPQARAALVGSMKYTPGGGATHTPDRGSVSDAELISMLEQVRRQTPRPLAPPKPGITSVRFHRVCAQAAPVCIRLTPGKAR